MSEPFSVKGSASHCYNNKQFSELCRMEAQNLTRPTLLGEEESPPQILGLVVVSPQYYISC
jgi:hypothetical protein